MYGKQSFYSKVELTSSFIGFNFHGNPITMGYRTVDIINYTHKLRNCY